jgi:zinc protease
MGVMMTLATQFSRPVTAAEATSQLAQQFMLDNGLQVVVIPDHRAPVVTHMIWYRVGSADEPRGSSGIAHFLEHLMFKGTDKIPAGEFSKIIARNGGQDNAFTSQDTTAYHQRIAKDRLPIVMEMEADRMRNLRLTEKDVVTEREVILEERRSRVDNDPSSILDEQMMAALYLSHPYGIPVIGWENEMAKLSREDAFRFYHHFYAPNNAIVIVAGDVTLDEVRQLATRIYGGIKREEDVGIRTRPQEPEPAAARRVTVRDERVGDATIERYYHVPSYNTAAKGEAEAIDMMIKILAAGPTSRLYNRLVVDDKIASQVSGWYSSSERDYGRLGLYATPTGKHSLEELEAEIDKVIAEVIAKGVTQDELDRARNSYIADYVYDVDSQMKLAQRYGWALAVGQTIADVEEWPQRLAKVTVDDVSRVAQKYLQPERSVTGLMLPIPAKDKPRRESTLAPGRNG